MEVVKAEGGVLRLDVDGKARRREEAVVLAVAPAEVGASAAREGEVGVLRGTVAMARSRDERGRGEHRAPSCQGTRTKVGFEARVDWLGLAVASCERADAQRRVEVAQLQPLAASQGCAVTKVETLRMRRERIVGERV